MKDERGKMGNNAKSGASDSFSFSPASTITEAESYISQFVDKYQFGAIGVSYDGIELDAANEINKTIGNFYHEFDMGKFGGILAPSGNSAMGRKVEGANAGYLTIRNGFLINRKQMKNVRTANANLQHEKEIVEKYLQHPENYTVRRPEVQQLLKRAKTSGRGTVAESIRDVIHHELGHMIEKKVQKHPLWGKVHGRMKTFADKISGYAGQDVSEYIAESFSSYRKGERIIDPDMAVIFKSIKRRQA